MTVRSVLRSLVSFLFYALFILVPLVFTSVNDELFEFNKMLAVYAITLCIAYTWICLCIIEKKILLKRTPFDVPLALFVGSQILSTVFSINVHTSIFGYYTRFNGGLLSVFSYVFLFYMFVEFVEKKKVRYFINALLIGGVLSALYALPEHFGHSPSCFVFSGKFDVSCWVQDVKTRVFGTFGQPNWLAAYLGMLLPLVIINTKTVVVEEKLMEDESSKHFISSLARFAIVFLFSSVLFFTGSRSGIGGVAAGLLLLCASTIAFFFIAKRNNHSVQYGPTIISYGKMLFLSVFVFAVCIFVFPNPLREKIYLYLPKKAALTSVSTASTPSPDSAPTGNTQLENGGSESGKIREIVWKGALRVWQRYPIFGSGVETFAYSYYRDRLKEHNTLSEWDFLYNKAHNEFLNYLATTGIVGLGTYLLLLGYFIAYPFLLTYRALIEKNHKKGSRPELIIHDSFLLVSLASGIIIICISNFLGFSTVMVSLLLFLFAAFIVVISNEQTPVKEEVDMSLAPSQLAILLVIVLLFLMPLLYVKRLWSADVAYARGKQLNNAHQYDTAFPDLRSAIDQISNEPTYHDEFSSDLASLAVSFARSNDATKASEFASMALKESDTTITENNVHTNFWKTRVRVFLTLAQLDENFYLKAKEALLVARDLSPTDPKVVYYLALIDQALKNDSSYKQYLLQAVDLKPNYEDARMALAKLYEDAKEPAKALEQYTYMVQFINPNNLVAQQKIASLSGTKK